MLEETVDQPCLAVEVFESEVCGCGRVFLRLRLVNWRRGGCDAVDGETFDLRSALNDRASCGEVQNIVRAFRNVRKLGLFVPIGL